MKKRISYEIEKPMDDAIIYLNTLYSNEVALRANEVLRNKVAFGK